MPDLQEQSAAVLGRMQPETLTLLQRRVGELLPITMSNGGQRRARWEALPEGQRPPASPVSLAPARTP